MYKRLSGKAFVAALGTVAIILLLLETVILPRMFQFVPPGYLHASNAENGVDISYKAMHQNLSDKPTIAFVGGSTIRESIETEEKFEDDFFKQGQDVNVLNFGSSGQTLAESFALISSLPIDKKTVIFLSVNFARLRLDWDQAWEENKTIRLPFLYSPLLQQFFSEHGYASTYRSHLVAHAPFFLWHIKYRLKYGKLPFLSKINTISPHVYKDESLPSEKKIRHIRRKHKSRYDGFKNGKAYSEAIIHRMKFYVEKNGGTLILLGGQKDPIAIKGLEPYFDEFNSFIQTLGIPYIDLTEPHYGIQFETEDFYDLEHLRPKGRQKFHTLMTHIVGEMDATKELFDN